MLRVDLSFVAAMLLLFQVGKYSEADLNEIKRIALGQ
jgi:hypothetical protein